MKETLVSKVDGAPVEILLVEDNPGDVRLTLEVFKDAKMSNKINVARDGVEAMEYLRREGKYAKAVRPGLILLDLNLPRMDGREVLDAIKHDENLRSIPVIILTSSKAEEDIIRSYGSYANCYITKPVGLSEFMKVVESVDDFWLTVVTLPLERRSQK